MDLVSAAAPAAALNPLPDADWFDRYEMRLEDGGLSAGEAARLILANPPAWAGWLMQLRNGLVRLAGLRGVAMKAGDEAGGFPILEERPERCVLGFNDRHLDFRIVVDIRQSGTGTLLGVTTLVKRHNLFGRAYLAAVGPFHRLIVPASLRQLQPQGARPYRAAGSEGKR
ncbi:hypothetical protein BJF92_20390 [Rhizobium rhizosphaerae]|uniref:DUF2867 domain-containing protein n=1 Tax=Xaviernesmea rhizosphaerae TaxID=1672749 RepID=A0A1Q9ALI6_9HYPH|nr:DUF2867 domain-containing protein [Xaviernesmea rhizosphaerae]OLP56155.1 hypothetical protein BJF92_20390 [Xaviernesmea rhizosphaerae]